jgi:ribulose bisphosphate carboxylase small subunit
LLRFPIFLPYFLWIAGFSILLVVLSIIWLVRVFTSELNRLRCDVLGYMGERATADQLRPLLHKGYFIYHDVQADDSGVLFNVDHILVGPCGIFVLETKVRQRRGHGKHIVYYDGNSLKWPGGYKNAYGLNQVARNSEWFRGFLQSRLNKTFDVHPILVFPGWYVEYSKHATGRVFSPKQSLNWIMCQPVSITDHEIKEICDTLESFSGSHYTMK